MDPRAAARALSWSRVLVGGLLLVAPRRGTAWWVGAPAAKTGTTVLVRALGVRDLLLGLSTLRALDGQGSAAAAAALRDGMVSDATDLAATLLAARRLPRAGAVLAAATAGSAVVAGGYLARALTRQS